MANATVVADSPLTIMLVCAAGRLSAETTSGNSIAMAANR
jgi:hypothetical protein